MLIAFSITIISMAAILFFSRRLLRYLYHFQAEEYSCRRLISWLRINGVYDRKGSAICIVAALAIELTKEKIIISLIVSMLGAIALVWLGFWEPNPCTVGETKLEMTERAIKMYDFSLTLYSCALIFMTVGIYALGANDDVAYYWLVAIAAIQSSPIWLFLAKHLLKA